MAHEPRQDDAERAAREWLGEPVDVRRLLSRMSAIALESVPGVDYASVCIRHPNGRLETVTATGPLIYEADGMQYDLNEGPGYDAVTDRDVAYAADLARDTRWPVFGPQAAALGLGSLLAIRLIHPGRLYIALNLYSHATHAFDEHREIVVHTFSSHAKHAFGQPQDVDTLSDAVSARIELDRATGVLMQRHGLDAEHAVALLTHSTGGQRQREVVAGIIRDAAARPRRMR